MAVHNRKVSMTRLLQSPICYGVGQLRFHRRKVIVKGRWTDLHCCIDLIVLHVAVRRRWAVRATTDDWKGRLVG